MLVTAECVIKDGSIKIPSSMGFPDGAKVVVSIELNHELEQRRNKILALAGAWAEDGSITDIFSEIAEKRVVYSGREMPSL